ncbi:MAG: helix-turn-helix domain-containing protein [Bacteroidia bacterium]|nr:helix-turn-helix domain-containing protein [Bacteroidia bacterium]
MEKSKEMDWYSMSDPAIVRELGHRIRQLRLNRNLTQATVAQKAGINRGTLSALENEGSCTLLTLIQVLRSLEELENLDFLLPDEGPSPLQLSRLEQKKRQRASAEKDSPEQSQSEW